MRKFAYGGSLLRETVAFARENKVYWIVPFVMLLLLAALVIFGSQTAAPFVYSIV